MSVVRVGPDGATLVADLPEVQDVTPVRRERGDDDEGDDDGRRRRIGPLWAITSGADPTMSSNQALWRIEGGKAELVADLFAFEESQNPHPAAVDSNPFDVESLGGERALVADAGGNTLLKVDEDGDIKLVAVLPDEEVSTANAEELLGEDFPLTLPAEPVATSVAIGPDGAYYVGELKGFPAPLGESRVWRIERDARNAKCGESPKCKVVLDGLTSIVDLRFGRDGKLYVAQIGRPELAGGGACGLCRRPTDARGGIRTQVRCEHRVVFNRRVRKADPDLDHVPQERQPVGGDQCPVPRPG